MFSVVHVRLSISGQHQGVETAGGQVHPEPVWAQRHHQLPGRQRRRRPRLRRRQRHHVLLGLENRIQLPEAPGKFTMFSSTTIK